MARPATVVKAPPQKPIKPPVEGEAAPPAEDNTETETPEAGADAPLLDLSGLMYQAHLPFGEYPHQASSKIDASPALDARVLAFDARVLALHARL